MQLTVKPRPFLKSQIWTLHITQLKQTRENKKSQSIHLQSVLTCLIRKLQISHHGDFYSLQFTVDKFLILLLIKVLRE